MAHTEAINHPHRGSKVIDGMASMRRLGCALSLRGSPTVSPITVAARAVKPEMPIGTRLVIAGSMKVLPDEVLVVFAVLTFALTAALISINVRV
jgi:hypothetical protein